MQEMQEEIEKSKNQGVSNERQNYNGEYLRSLLETP